MPLTVSRRVYVVCFAVLGWFAIAVCPLGATIKDP